jgi:tyrosyl-tRNA synthetase
MRADGQKFGKTADGQNVWLNAELTSPYAFYQFWVNVEDADIGRMMRHYSLRPLEDIEDTLAAGKAAPEARIAQRALAEELTTFVHGSAELAGIQRATDLLFGKGSAQDLRALSPEQLRTLAQAVPHTVMPTSLVTAGTRLLQLFVQSQLLPSNSEARRAFAQGGLKVNKEPLPSESEVLAGAHLLHSRFLLLQKGKREYHLVEFQG